MNTLLSCFMILQATIYTANIETVKDVKKNEKNKENEPSQNGMNEINRYYHYFQAVTKKNNKQKELYDAIVRMFYDKFCRLRHFDNMGIDLLLILPEVPDNNTIDDFLRNKKDECMKEKGITDKDLDLAFICAYDMFVDISKYIIKTFLEIQKLLEKSTDKIQNLKELSKNKELLEKYILSVNWLTRLHNKKPIICLLYNYNNIEITGVPGRWKKSIRINYEFFDKEIDYKIDQKIFDSVKETLINRCKEIELSSKENPFKLTNIQEIKEYCISKLPDQYVNRQQNEVSFIFDAIAYYLGLFTKIDYVAKTGYYENKKFVNVTCTLSKLQYTFLKELDEYFNDKLKYNLDFDVLQMHEPTNILKFFALFNEFSDKITYLTDFTKLYVDELTSSIKEKLENTIKICLTTKLAQKACNDDKINEVKQDCIDAINTIKSHTFYPENPITATKVVQRYKVDIVDYINNACEQILERIEKHLQNNEENKRLIDIYKTETEHMGHQISNAGFDGKLSRILDFQSKINNDMQTFGQYKLLDMENFTYNTTYDAIIKSAYQSRTILRDSNKDVGETDTLYSLVYNSALRIIEHREEQQKEYNLKYISIINNIIELKRLIIEVEQDAVKLIAFIRKYNDYGDEHINKRRKTQ